jgi:DNA-3-methyladenine glycosylase
MTLLPHAFYLRPVDGVARALLGQEVHHGEVRLRITEVEAYGGQEDSASHCRFGKTKRNAVMWEAGGSAYIYLCYGIHHMLNVVSGLEGEGAAILIRSCEPVAGLETLRARRGGIEGPSMLAGPGKVAQALGLDASFNGAPLFKRGGLTIHKGHAPNKILTGPRVGVDFAKMADRDRRWRFALDSAWVSVRKTLVPDE